MASANKAPLATELVAEVADHYDTLDPFYRTVWGEHVHHGLWITGKETKDEAVEALCQLVLEKLQVQPDDRVCDVGCGYGALARMLSRQYGAQVTGLTVSTHQWEYARKLGDARQQFILGDWLENQVPDECFDKLVAVESSEHMCDKRKFFTEIYRVLRRGGTFAVTAWLRRESPRRLENACLLRPICIEGRLSSLEPVSEYQELLRQSGFSKFSFQDLTGQVSKTWSVCIRRFGTSLLIHPRLLTRLFARNFRNRIFALTIFRLWLAYRLGSVQYGLFWGAK